MTLFALTFYALTFHALTFHALTAMGSTAGVLGALLLCTWRCWNVLQQGTHYVRQLHDIPCSQCAYFTGDYRLKCTVSPTAALTEAAIGCPDYEPTFRQPAATGCGGLARQASSCPHVRELMKR
ncbi:MAG: hypothetical protein AAF152_12765 [Cyanobacteria bacterium P01_A01_bin.114]